MTEYSFTLRQDHTADIRSLVLPEGGHEGKAYVVCGCASIERDPWTGGAHRKFLSVEVLAPDRADVVSSSATHVTMKNRTFVRALKRARDEDLVVVVVHSHPNGPASFSPQDDGDEPY